MKTQKRPKSIAQKLDAFLVVNIIRLVGQLPLSVAHALGTMLARFSLVFNTRGTRITKKNIALCYPELDEKQARELIKKSVIETGKLATEICLIGQKDSQWTRQKILNIKGVELFKQKIATGKGVILISPHIGNWEIMGLFAADCGNIMCMYQPPKKSYLEKLIIKFRSSNGIELAPTNQRGVVKILKFLKAGGITGILPDQVPARGSGEYTRFFNHDAYTMTFIHGLLQRTESLAIFGFVKRLHNGFEVHFLEPPEALYSDNLAESLAALNLGIQECIQHCPEQYQWEYKRFRSVDDRPNVY